MGAKTGTMVDLDLARLIKRVREAFRTMKVAEDQEVSARDLAAARRLELGQALTEARGRWPARGPNAKGWGEFLRTCEIDEDVALHAMKYSNYIGKHFPSATAERPGKLPTLTEAGIRRSSLTGEVEPEAPKADRGAWCTPEPIAKAVGRWRLDPFSNPRSHIIADEACMLERGDDGFGDRRVPGSFQVNGKQLRTASAAWKVWIQPDYGFVLEAIRHYGHTRFCALLRLDPSTEWFAQLHARSELILIPKGDRIEFDPPPGVEASSNPYPHGLFYARATDATDEIRALCFEWRVHAA